MKRKILKFIARFKIFFRFTIKRDCRISLIEYSMMKLKNTYSDIEVHKFNQK